MRESLGVVFENQSISTALVDADTPLLGSIDEFRHPWGADGTVPSPQASARALASAAEVATGRALRSNLCPTVVGVMCERADVRDLVSDSLSSSPFENVELVNGLDARLAYLRTVDALIGVSPILAFWPDGSETVIAAVDPRAGVVDSAHRYDTAELLADSSTFAATLDLLVAERDPVPKMLVAMLVKEDSRQPSAEAAELAGLGFLFLGESDPTGDRGCAGSGRSRKRSSVRWRHGRPARQQGPVGGGNITAASTHVDGVADRAVPRRVARGIHG